MMNQQHIDGECDNFHCGDCKYWKHPCDGGCQKRIDHKSVKFAKPWFSCYDGNQFRGVVCSNFWPSQQHVYARKHWTSFNDYWAKYIENCLPYSNTRRLVYFTLGENTNIKYGVRLLDFVYNNMYDGNKLKAVQKMYYKRCKTTNKNPCGYKLITEKIDGVEIAKI